MPKSKRNKQVELSKTRKQGLERKNQLQSQIRECTDQYDHLFIFSVADMRNGKMKEVREQWKDSRFFIGKNKVMAMALGRSEEEDYKPGLHKISQRLRGERGLLFSNRSPDEVIKWFENYSDSDYARSGNAATEDVFLNEGPLPQFPHNLESYLRQLGLPTTLKKGIVHLVKDYEVCKEGDILSPDTARVLKLLDYMMAEFHVKIECYWSKDGSFETLVPELENEFAEKIITPKKRKIFETRDLDKPESMEITEEIEMKLENEPKAKKSRQEDDVESENQNDEDDDEDEKVNEDEEKENEEEEEKENEEEEEKENEEEEEKENEEEEEKENEEEEEKENEEEEEKENEEEEVPDEKSRMELTKKKLEDSGKKQKKFSPKMTRSRAKAAQNVTEVVVKPDTVKKRKGKV